VEGSDTGERARKEFALVDNEIPAGALDQAGISISGPLDDIRLFEEPGGPVVAVAPDLPLWPSIAGTSQRPASARKPVS
jgi:hypothetical protein